LTYRSVLSLFPGLVALVALLGLLGQYPQTFDAVLKIVGSFAPHSTVQTVSVPIRQIITHRGGAGALFGVGLAGAIWAASGYVGTFRGRRTSSGKLSVGGPGIGSGRSTWRSLWSPWCW